MHIRSLTLYPTVRGLQRFIAISLGNLLYAYIVYRFDKQPAKFKKVSTFMSKKRGHLHDSTRHHYETEKKNALDTKSAKQSTLQT